MKGVIDKCNQNNDPLSLACRMNREEIIEILIESGAGVRTRDSEGLTPLHNAAAGGWKELVLFLLANGAESHVSNDGKQTPVYFACINRHHEIVKLLLKHVASHEEHNISACIEEVRRLRSLQGVSLSDEETYRYIIYFLEKTCNELPSLFKLASCALFRGVHCRTKNLIHLNMSGQLPGRILAIVLLEFGFEKMHPKETKPWLN